MSRTILSKLNAPHPLTPSPEGEREKVVACWESPSNIALIKYWGKKGMQLPMNPSISMTLKQSCTMTRVEALWTKGSDGKVVSVNNDKTHPFLPRLEKFTKWLSTEIPVLGNLTFMVETSSTFPHSTGIASSASGISAFTLCLLSIAENINGKEIPIPKFMTMASFASRMGSGSACRSLYGGFTVWGRTQEMPGSSDLFAIPVTERVNPSMRTLHDTILVVSSTPKSLPSSLGHSMMDQHPFTPSRIRQAKKSLTEVLKALTLGDLDRLAELVEAEALTLHSLIMSSPGGTILMEPQTVQIIRQIRAARQKGLPVFFSLDAGPNVHMFYPESAVPEVEPFIREELVPLCENGTVIFDQCGAGPVKINPEKEKIR
jgi:diphosphomevalonate decarboxylase